MALFKIGFMGAAKEDNVLWAAKHTKGAKTICVPFTGSCRTIAAMARHDTTIESWDTQIISRAIIDGVFKAKKSESNLTDKPRYRKGHMYESRAFKGIDDASAGFIDWVGEHGTLYDKVAIFSAAVRSTLMGRMQDWNGDIDELWYKYNRSKKYLEQWLNMPGKFIHHEASFFDPLTTKSYDAILIDPPKVVQTSDIYSRSFNDLNIALGGTIEIPTWGWRDVIGWLRMTFNVDAEKILLFYVSDVRPSLPQVKTLLAEFGEIQEHEEVMALNKSRYDYGVLALRERASGG